MKVFISWSGELSRKIAIQLREWLPVVLPFANPWVSCEDTPKGSRWGLRLAAELEDASSGIICVVPGNSSAPWLNFEAGALSKTVDTARIHPLLFGVETRDLPDTLSQFQATCFDKEDVRRLVAALNGQAADSALVPERLRSNFDTCWPNLEARLGPLISEAHTAATATPAGPRAESPGRGNELTDEQIAILRFMVDSESERVFPADAADELKVHPERARHLMEQMEELGLLHAIENYVDGTSWRVSREGRAELVNRQLL